MLSPTFISHSLFQLS